MEFDDVRTLADALTARPDAGADRIARFVEWLDDAPPGTTLSAAGVRAWLAGQVRDPSQDRAAASAASPFPETFDDDPAIPSTGVPDDGSQEA